MDRLTIPDQKMGSVVIRSVIDARKVKGHAMTIYWALKEYEDTGLTPQEIMQLKERMNDGKCGECSRRKWYQKGYEDGRGKSNDGWVPVEDRLPTKEECEKDNNEFLVQTDTGERFSCEYDPLANGFDNPLWCCNVPVVAWQPLPEPYQREEAINEKE